MANELFNDKPSFVRIFFSNAKNRHNLGIILLILYIIQSNLVIFLK